MIEHRPFQELFESNIYDAWTRARAVLGVLPTGGGKTVVFSSIIHDHVGASAAVVHRKEIIRQISVSLAKLGVKHRIVGAEKMVRGIRRRHLREFGKSFVDPHAACGVVSVQTLTSRGAAKDTALQRWVGQVTLAVFDEGHHYVRQGQWGRAVDAFARAKLLFVTATPTRADGKGLGVHADGFVEEMVVGPSTAWLTRQGYLTPFRYFCPESDFTMDEDEVGANGDFTHQGMRKKAVQSHIVGDVVDHYVRFTPGLQCIVFAPDVATADDMAEAFRKRSITAVALSGETDSELRDRELDKFEAKQTQVLVNVDLFDEGFDVPAVEVVLMARPTASLAKYLQMVGRALRILDGKEYAYIIDPVRNWERHQMPDWPRTWTLDARPKGVRRSLSDLEKQVICLGCSQPYPGYLLACPHQLVPECLHPPEPPGRSLPEEVAGDLAELDQEALAGLFAQVAAANLTDEEYDADLIARHVPHIGRGAARRRNRAERQRRAVLRELVGWWVGMQPAGRDLREVHKRFYSRFGIDIVLAFALDVAGTDALINAIQLKFTEDMT
jgi:DNA repair protein RadD